MRQDFTLHTHTLGCDGKNTPAQMIARATELGMTTIGISNHFIVHPRIQESNFYPHAVRCGYNHIYSTSFDEIMARFIPIYDEIGRAASESKIRVLRGLEVDYFPDSVWRRNFERAISVLKPDYLIGACHFIEIDGVPYNVHDMLAADADTQTTMVKRYWNKICDASNSGMFAWMAHLDLPRKVGVGTNDNWRIIERMIIDTLTKNQTPIEINTALQPEPYPSHRILKLVANANLPVLISDDAHRTEQIGRFFDDAEKICEQAGIKNRLSVQKILDFSKKTL